MIAHKQLKKYPKFNQRTFSSISTVDETWVLFYQPNRKCSNKIWATKNVRRPSIAKRTTNMKKVMYAIFYNSRDETDQAVIPRRKKVTGKLYQLLVMKKFKKYLKKSRPRLGLQSPTLLDDNAPVHTPKRNSRVLDDNALTILLHPPYSPDLAPCDFFLFPCLKKLPRVRDITQDRLLGRQCFSVLRVYLRKTTPKLSINELKYSNFVFVLRRSILKGCT